MPFRGKWREREKLPQNCISILEKWVSAPLLAEIVTKMMGALEPPIWQQKYFTVAFFPLKGGEGNWFVSFFVCHYVSENYPQIDTKKTQLCNAYMACLLGPPITLDNRHGPGVFAKLLSVNKSKFTEDNHPREPFDIQLNHPCFTSTINIYYRPS